MYSLKIPLDNVSLRAFLYLSDDRNIRRELSNTTISDYVLKHYDAVVDRYKDRRSFQSGYAGNLSLIFDSSDAQEARLNKFKKVLPPLLRECLRRQSAVQIQIDGRYCVISRITREEDYQLLAVFFCLKPINASLNRHVGIDNPDRGWLRVISASLEMPMQELGPLRTTQTGRGDTGRRSILNRKTVHNRGGVWFDIAQPAYYDFEMFRHKAFLRSLLIEQSNYLFAIPVLCDYHLPFQKVFAEHIKIVDGEPTLGTRGVDIAKVESVHLILKDELREYLLSFVPVPKSYQYTFRVDDKNIYFSGGYVVPLTRFQQIDAQKLKSMSSISPAITVNSELESEIKANVTRLIMPNSLSARLYGNGTRSQESETVARFGALSNAGKLKLRDYTRERDGTVQPASMKTCLIVITGTQYPDLVCIFLEDAEKIERKADLSLDEYLEHIRANLRRFEHLLFEVEVEYNLSSFGVHDTSQRMAGRSKYIFYESGTGTSYLSRFSIEIPAVRLAEVAM